MISLKKINLNSINKEIERVEGWEGGYLLGMEDENLSPVTIVEDRGRGEDKAMKGEG
jgi:hypothetical protein